MYQPTRNAYNRRCGKLHSLETVSRSPRTRTDYWRFDKGKSILEYLNLPLSIHSLLISSDVSPTEFKMEKAWTNGTVY